MHKRRVELATQGIDDALQGITSDPFGAPQANAVGLRIPGVLPSDSGPHTRPRYLFCLATRNIVQKTRIIGIRQGVTLGVDTSQGAAPPHVVEFFVRTPTFKFTDGNISWHLVKETNTKPSNRKPSTDSANWAQRWTDGPAMLYETFTNAAVDPVTGAPLIYMLGLTAYTPPAIATGAWKPISSLGMFYDIRFPWDTSPVWNGIDQVIDANCKISLYASVLQSNSQTRTNATFTTPPPLGATVDPQEEVFIKNFTFATGEFAINAPVYWRIMGALIFEDDA